MLESSCAPLKDNTKPDYSTLYYYSLDMEEVTVVGTHMKIMKAMV